MGPIEKTIEEKIKNHFQPSHLVIENESHKHNVPDNSETHFKALIVSAAFNEMKRIDRQRSVNELLKDELAGPVHAFSQRLYSPEEWQKTQKDVIFETPDCRGGDAKSSS